MYETFVKKTTRKRKITRADIDNLFYIVALMERRIAYLEDKKKWWKFWK